MNVLKFQPVIKWSGSKRSQASEILKYFPDEIDTYFEPFCGGCSILMALMNSEKKIGKYITSDLNNDLISLWKAIKERPVDVHAHYYRFWHRINNLPTLELRKECYYALRERFNKERNPLDFMCITRLCVNGMPRYNTRGEFNSPYHFSRPGISPDKLKEIILEWSHLLNKNNVQFHCCNYDDLPEAPTINDFIYLDPPYANTKGMYYGSIDNNRLFNFLEGIDCGYAMSFDGISGEENHTYPVPERLYDRHLYIKSGNSSFKRTIGKSNNSIVYESLYVRKRRINSY